MKKTRSVRRVSPNTILAGKENFLTGRLGGQVVNLRLIAKAIGDLGFDNSLVMKIRNLSSLLAKYEIDYESERLDRIGARKKNKGG